MMPIARARIVIVTIGASLGGTAIVGLLNPLFVVRLAGFSLADPASPYQFSEVRAVYGGLFGVIGVFTMLSAIDPVASRGRLVALGWCWLGLAGGRLLGVMLDGNPGLQGWTFVAWEMAAGVLLLACTILVSRPSARPAAA